MRAADGGPADPDLKQANRAVGPPGLWVLTRTGLAEFGWDAAAGKYMLQAKGETGEPVKRRLAHASYVCLAGKSLVVMAGNRLLQLDRQGRPGRSRTFATLGAFTTSGNHVFVCAEGALIACDENLKELSRAELTFGGGRFPRRGGGKKNAHDILVRDNVAYLLDNIMAPIFLFRADVSNPRRIRVIQKHESMGVNLHLATQWLEPGGARWMVLESSSTLYGAWQRIVAIPLSEKGALFDKPARYGLWNWDRRTRKGSGTQILAVTRRAPIWALVREAKDKALRLAPLRTGAQGVSFGPGPKLKGVSEPHPLMVLRMQRGYLFIARTNGTAVHVLRVSDKLKRVADIDLRPHGLRDIQDVAVQPE